MKRFAIQKIFFDIAIAGRHRGLSTIYIMHNLFHQSKLGRDVELQNTHIVVFKSPRDVMQVGTLSAQLGLGSELVDWYRDATSVSHPSVCGFFTIYAAFHLFKFREKVITGVRHVNVFSFISSYM